MLSTKRSLALVGVAIFPLLVGCQSTEETQTTQQNFKNLNYLDLRSPEIKSSDYWVIDKTKSLKQTLPYPEKLAKREENGCATLNIGINSDGNVTGYATEHSYPGAFVAEAAAASFNLTKWVPGEKNPEARPAILTITVVLKAPHVEDSAAFIENCEQPLENERTQSIKSAV